MQAIPTKRVLAACGVLTLALAGCTPADVTGPHHEVTTTDKHRRDVMLSEPVLKLAIARPTVDPGERVARTEWNRGRIEAYLLKNQDPVPNRRPEDVTNKIREAFRVMRADGWLPIYSECDPPVHLDEQGLSPSPTPTASPQAGAELGEHSWAWRLFLYRVRDGVSYWAGFSGTSEKKGAGYTAVLYLDLVAPQEHDPADLFPDRPPALRDADICVQDARPPRAPRMNGKPIMVDYGSDQTLQKDRQQVPGRPHR